MLPTPLRGTLAGCLALSIASVAADDTRLYGLAVHSLTSTSIGDAVQIKGNVESNSYSEIGAGARITGDVLSSGSAWLRSYALVQGNLTANSITAGQAGSKVIGTQSSGVSVPSIPIDNSTVTAGTTAITLANNEIRTLAPGNYGAIYANAKSALRLSSGTYNFSSLNLQPDVVLRINIIAGAPIRINILGDVNFGDRTAVVVDGGDASQVRFHCTSTKTTDAFRIGTSVSFVGVVSAPLGEIHVYSGNPASTVSGALWGKAVKIEPYVGMITLDGPIPPSTGSISGSVLNGYLGNVHAFFTADNHYAHVFGRTDGSALTLAGRNETGATGLPYDQVTNPWNWSKAEEYNYVVGPDDHLYIIAWDCGGYRMWAGQFDLNATGKLYSNTTEWEYIDATGLSPHQGPEDNNGNDGHVDGPLPSLTDLSKEIAKATWKPLQASANNDGSIWSVIPNLDAASKMVWSTQFRTDATADEYKHYQIFRSKGALIPRLPVPSWRVFLDANGNGQLDPGEVSTLTDANGNFTFAGLAAGTYKVVELPASGWQQVRPASNASISVTLAADQNLTGADFVVQHP